MRAHHGFEHHSTDSSGSPGHHLGDVRYHLVGADRSLPNVFIDWCRRVCVVPRAKCPANDDGRRSVMLMEAGLAFALVYLMPAQGILGAAWIGIGLLAVVWGTTAFFSPCSRRIVGELRFNAHDRLVTTNWIRTLGWTARLFIAWAIARAPDAIH